MVKSSKKILALFLAIMTLCSIISCNYANKDYNNDNTQNPQYIFPAKENTVNNTQYYTGIEDVRFPNRLWLTPAYERAAQYDREELGVQAYFLKSVDYDGAPTYVFAYVGIPDAASEDNPVPGIVLIHGGDGTAFADWVKMWNDKGYAAIAIDTEGRIPNSNASLSSTANISSESIKHHGPENKGYSDYAEPVDQQYLYHAIAATIVANSFLSSFKEVDSRKIGLTGISWGGVIATNAAAYDDRFAFAAPVYGAVAMTGTSGKFGTLYSNYPRCSALWDNIDMLRNCRTPILFVNWDGDPYFTIDATENCANTAINGRMLLIPDLQHSHWRGANIQEIFNFANSVLQYG